MTRRSGGKNSRSTRKRSQQSGTRGQTLSPDTRLLIPERKRAGEPSPSSRSLTGPASPRRLVCALEAAFSWSAGCPRRRQEVRNVNDDVTKLAPFGMTFQKKQSANGKFLPRRCEAG